MHTALVPHEAGLDDKHLRRVKNKCVALRIDATPGPDAGDRRQLACRPLEVRLGLHIQRARLRGQAGLVLAAQARDPTLQRHQVTKQSSQREEGAGGMPSRTAANSGTLGGALTTPVRAEQEALHAAARAKEVDTAVAVPVPLPLLQEAADRLREGHTACPLAAIEVLAGRQPQRVPSLPQSSYGGNPGTLACHLRLRRTQKVQQRHGDHTLTHARQTRPNMEGTHKALRQATVQGLTAKHRRHCGRRADRSCTAAAGGSHGRRVEPVTQPGLQ
mmetsp:Transcript_48387/g.144489  ORF Transcript_48387/g.144489 Transcript_48387/m.144489 type:complete len:274 (+) Transcript_48387:321-1142(+)